MSRRELKSLQIETTEWIRSGRTQQAMDDTVGDSLADELRRLEAELAEAREAIASKDGELGDLRSQVDEAKAETLPNECGCWSSSWRASVSRRNCSICVLSRSYARSISRRSSERRTPWMRSASRCRRGSRTLRTAATRKRSSSRNAF